MEKSPQRRSSYYSSFSCGSVVLAYFASFFLHDTFYGSEWNVVVAFGLGAVFTVLTVFSREFLENRRPWMYTAYFALQCVIVTALIFLSPVRGFFGIIVFPLCAQAVFLLRPPGAALVNAYLFAATVAVWGIPNGWPAAWEAVLSYSTGFVFTIVFTIITRQSLDARARAEKLRREVEEANRQLQEYAEQAGDLATARERNRVAREIHDGVGHYLTVIKTQLDAAVTLLPAQPDKARETVAKATRLASEALDDVRRSVGALRADTHRPPLPEALKELVAQGSPVPTFAITGAPRPVSSAVEHALFRAAQEGLTNIRKHARATSALLVLDFRSPQRIRLELSDNGVGAMKPPAGSGFGLVGLRERIELLGGQIKTANRLNGGFALTIEVPA